MISKEVSVPKALRELHGEKTRVSTLVLVYLTGAITAGIVVLQFVAYALPTWRIILTTILFLDIAGGVVANLSTSTNRYYQGQPRQRLLFLLMHILHPAILMIVFPASTPYAVFTLFFTLTSMAALNIVKDTEFQQNLAALLVTIGICLSFLYNVPVPILYAFAPLFMVKLILGFSVQRPPFFSMNS